MYVSPGPYSSLFPSTGNFPSFLHVLVDKRCTKVFARSSKTHSQIEEVEQDTAQSMATLVELDRVKVRMEATSGALQEADNWTTLSEAVDEAFQDGNLDKMSSTLLGMQRRCGGECCIVEERAGCVRRRSGAHGFVAHCPLCSPVLPASWC